MRAQVAVLRTRPETVLVDYGRLMRLAKYDQVLPRDQDCLLKLNLSWTKYFPACSTQPWQLEGVLNTLFEDGYVARHLFPVENGTVVTDPGKGAPFIPLTEVEWIRYHDLLWYPTIGRARVRAFGETAWGRLFEGY